MARPKIDAREKVISNNLYLRVREKDLILAEHGTIAAWVQYEVKRLQKKSLKKVS